jgi:hypothetical protein
MAIITGNITGQGATVVVLVGVSRNRQRLLEKMGLLVPPKIPVCAEIDTGSFATGFLPEVYQRLGITTIGPVRVSTPSTRHGEGCLTDQYDVSITLVGNSSQLFFPSVLAIAGDDFSTDEDAPQGILGRDVLNRCVFNYYGPDQTFRLAF